jgi:hypothetical protein
VFKSWRFEKNTPQIAPNPYFVIMDPSMPSLKNGEKHVVFEIYGNHSNEVNPPLSTIYHNEVRVMVFNATFNNISQ